MGQDQSAEKKMINDSTPCHRFEGEAGTYFCDGDCHMKATVWGTGPYTADSCVCRAARHAGVIADKGGAFTVLQGAGMGAYEGSEANGVISYNFGQSASSITFDKARKK
jgi:hypothetical protein